MILMAGLQGSGKTTAAAKLARLLRVEHRSSVALAACDAYRPAAVEQLVIVGEQAGATVYQQGTERTPRARSRRWALERARTDGKDVLIVDTAGRLHVDERADGRAGRDPRRRPAPDQVLLVVDAMTGQDAVNVAEQFAAAVAFDGVVLTKLDGDARGGAALSVRAVTGKPILFASTGEKLDAVRALPPRSHGTADPRHGRRPDADREGRPRGRRARGQGQLEQRLQGRRLRPRGLPRPAAAMRRMGPLQGLLGMIPGVGAQMRGMKVDEREIDRIEAIILSMTPHERRRPELIKGSRRLRIARGSGTSVQAVNQMVKQFAQVRKVMRQMGRGPDARPRRADAPESLSPGEPRRRR